MLKIPAAVLIFFVAGCANAMMPDPTLGAQSLNPAESQLVLDQVLKDERLWGTDAFAVFASVDLWRQQGESSIVFFTDRVASGTAFETPAEAERSAGKIAKRMEDLAPALLKEPFSSQYEAATKDRRSQIRVEFSSFMEDDSYRVVWKSDEGRFLKRGITTSSIIEAYGPAEQKTTRVVDTRGERRPAVLTEYHYANDTVIFVETDLAPEPGFVDRVVLDVDATATRILAP
jgi:hypothetical protein